MDPVTLALAKGYTDSKAGTWQEIRRVISARSFSAIEFTDLPTHARGFRITGTGWTRGTSSGVQDVYLTINNDDANNYDHQLVFGSTTSSNPAAPVENDNKFSFYGMVGLSSWDQLGFFTTTIVTHPDRRSCAIMSELFAAAPSVRYYKFAGVWRKENRDPEGYDFEPIESIRLTPRYSTTNSPMHKALTILEVLLP